MCDAAVWAAQRSALERQSFRVQIAADPLGSPLAVLGQEILDRHAGPLLVAGHSKGGRVALEVARRAGDRLRGLALLDTGYKARDAGAAGSDERESRMQLVAMAVAAGMSAAGTAWVQGMVHPARLADGRLIADIVNMFARHSPEQFAAQQRALLERPDAADVLASLRCPTLVLCGAQDRWSPPAQHAEIAGMVSGATLVQIPDCGHMSTMERPDEVSGALLQWARNCLGQD